MKPLFKLILMLAVASTTYAYDECYYDETPYCFSQPCTPPSTCCFNKAVIGTGIVGIAAGLGIGYAAFHHHHHPHHHRKCEEKNGEICPDLCSCILDEGGSICFNFDGTVTFTYPEEIITPNSTVTPLIVSPKGCTYPGDPIVGMIAGEGNFTIEFDFNNTTICICDPECGVYHVGLAFNIDAQGNAGPIFPINIDFLLDIIATTGGIMSYVCLPTPIITNITTQTFQIFGEFSFAVPDCIKESCNP